ncbi:MAG TPA: L-sorbosone dehydrogenase [Solibacterales bacterium]|nr:L-sorbosone dehydrogenase [Bryobacterales bacterium]
MWQGGMALATGGASPTMEAMSNETLCLTVAMALGAVAAAGQAPPSLPDPYHTPSASNAPTVVSRPEAAQLRLPEGFSIQEFAGGFERPRYMIVGPSGEVLLSDAARKGSVYALFDKDKDGKADDRKLLIGELDRPYGLALWRDFLYIAETTAVKRYKYDAKSYTLGPAEMVVDLSAYATGHWTRSILFNKAGDKFYLGIGSRSNVEPGEPEPRAAISRCNPDGSGCEVIAAGTRNPIGLDFEPTTGRLWAAVQERDGLGDDLVPDYFTSIQEGGFYGWPYAYIGPREEPRLKGKNPELVKKTIVPDVVLQAHVAVLDSRFYTGKQFPPKYQGGAFLAFHGSWNRAERVGYSVAFVPFRNGKPAGPVEDFLTGFMLDPTKREVWGRPVGLLQLPDGSLLVSDDGGNRLWHISYKK